MYKFNVKYVVGNNFTVELVREGESEHARVDSSFCRGSFSFLK